MSGNRSLVPGDHSECGPDCVITGDACDGSHATTTTDEETRKAIHAAALKLFHLPYCNSTKKAWLPEECDCPRGVILRLTSPYSGRSPEAEQ